MIRKNNTTFLYTMQKPTCGLTKFTNNPWEAEQHSKDGWIVTCKGMGINGNKKFK